MIPITDRASATLKKLRLEKGFSQEKLGEIAHVSRQAVSRWENGETMPSVDTLKELSGIFGVTINMLLGEPVRLVCQCCGMELNENSISVETDGSANPNYCKWCYTDGEFVYKTLPDLVEYLVNHVPIGCLTKEEAAKRFTDKLLKLSYWKNKD